MRRLKQLVLNRKKLLQEQPKTKRNLKSASCTREIAYGCNHTQQLKPGNESILTLIEILPINGVRLITASDINLIVKQNCQLQFYD